MKRTLFVSFSFLGRFLLSFFFRIKKTDVFTDRKIIDVSMTSSNKYLFIYYSFFRKLEIPNICFSCIRNFFFLFFWGGEGEYFIVFVIKLMVEVGFSKFSFSISIAKTLLYVTELQIVFCLIRKQLYNRPSGFDLCSALMVKGKAWSQNSLKVRNEKPE